ncbi:PQQ-dependent sugar dehydrogenase [Thiohalomonas denitrificans]|uniref:Glucose/arabinose dehydrogenase, beta-propeller fold n=1 Tax=Thiohalomonas denitrificans TaxID=415747 RepID=A0A1G5QK72_9GAMM|nr:PQQ-dependent sugar dehydrogenase [Thiohalomonas denitrificans]SCZ62223.1 Glucose/arabinose dehydrogenase, beta-propeller fold [Thiohalomonas denitrificans]
MEFGRPVLVMACFFSLIACVGGGGGATAVDDDGKTSPDDATHSIMMTPVADGLENPWALAFLTDGDILVTERPGRLRLIQDGNLVEQPVTGLPEVWVGGQGGLLDVEAHPDFANNRLIYFSYSAGTDSEQTTRVTRARYENGALSELLTIFEAEPYRDSSKHFGSRLAFDSQNFLYISLGERGDRAQAQDRLDHVGSIIRIHDDGRVPADNPFFSAPDARSELFSIGHRNPQGLTRNPFSGDIWSHEHGPQGGDEVNLIRAGLNYGWPEITHGTNYDGTPIGPSQQEGMEPPLYHWAPTSIAPSGMAFYTGDRFPNWEGDLFLGALAGRALVRLQVAGNEVTGEERLLESEEMRIRDVAEGPDGYLWIVTDHNPGQLIRLEPAE